MYDSENSCTAHRPPEDMFESNRTAWNEAMEYHRRARGEALRHRI